MWQEVLTLIGFPVVRSVAGWAENALKDDVITGFEWKQLGSTVLRVGIMGVAAYFGLNEMGIDVSAVGAGASSVILDFILSAVKKKKE